MKMLNNSRYLGRHMGALLIVSVVACGPANKSIVEVGEPQDMPAGVGGGEDRAVKVDLEVQEIKGVTFDPSGLDNPELPGNGVTIKSTIAAQEKKVAKAKGAAKAKESYELALLQWYTPPAGEGKEARKALKKQREAALGILTGLAADGAAGEDWVAAYAAAELAVGDNAKGVAALDALITKFPQSAKLARYQALRNYHDVKARKAPALPMPDKLDGAPYEAAYVDAWVKFRAADKAGAVAAITVAAKGWTNLESMPSIRRDVMLMYSRAGGDPQAAWTLMNEPIAKDKGGSGRILNALAEAYIFAGEFDAGAKLLDKQVENAEPARVAQIRQAQSLTHFRALRAAEAADALIAAWKGVEAAGDKASADLKEGVAKQMYTFALTYHSDYAKTHDPRFAEPAMKLYQAYAAIPGRADAEQVKTDNIPKLEATIKAYADTATAGVGLVDQQVVQRRVLSNLEQVGACFEAELQGDPTLAFEVKLSFRVGADGKLTKIAVDKAGDGRGAPAVGKCLGERAGSWAFPASGSESVVTYPFTFKAAQ